MCNGHVHELHLSRDVSALLSDTQPSRVAHRIAISPRQSEGQSSEHQWIFIVNQIKSLPFNAAIFIMYPNLRDNDDPKGDPSPWQVVDFMIAVFIPFG